MPITPGDWQWTASARQSVARFAGGRLTMSCDIASHTMTISRNEPGATFSGPVLMTVITQTQMRPFHAEARSGSVSVSVPARDGLLDAMAFSRGRFAVEVTGFTALYVPSWTEISRVIEDCR